MKDNSLHTEEDLEERTLNPGYQNYLCIWGTKTAPKYKQSKHDRGIEVRVCGAALTFRKVWVRVGWEGPGRQEVGRAHPCACVCVLCTVHAHMCLCVSMHAYMCVVYMCVGREIRN
jgi:hypothetical protein